MPTYYISGSPAAVTNPDGLSESNPWPFSRLMEYLPQPGDTIRLAAGAMHAGALEWFGPTDPDRPITLGRYGDAALPNPVIASGERRGLWWGGSGLVVDRVDFSGSGLNGIEVSHALDGGPSRNIYLKWVLARGYSLAGVMFNVVAPVSDILVAGCNLSGNANGLFMSGASTEGNLLRNILIADTAANDNNLFHPDSRGNGFSLVGVSHLKVLGCEAWRNGSISGQGHSGITVQQGDGVLVAHCKAGDTAPGPDGDGQDFVLVSTQNGVVEYCESHGGHVGFSNHDDRIYHEPRWQSRWNVFRHNRAVRNIICYQFFLGRGGIHLHDCQGHTWAAQGEYRKVLDFWPALAGQGGSVRLRGNTFRAGGDALLLEAAGPDGLREVYFDNDLWLAAVPRFVVQGVEVSTLAEALALPLNEQAELAQARQVSTRPRIVCPPPERPVV